MYVQIVRELGQTYLFENEKAKFDNKAAWSELFYYEKGSHYYELIIS